MTTCSSPRRLASAGQAGGGWVGGRWVGGWGSGVRDHAGAGAGQPACLSVTRSLVDPPSHAPGNPRTRTRAPTRCPTRAQVTVVIKGMFEPDEFIENPLYKEELEADLRAECGKLGRIDKVCDVEWSCGQGWHEQPRGPGRVRSRTPPSPPHARAHTHALMQTCSSRCTRPTPRAW